MAVIFNLALQRAGDPRWWPRDLPLPRKTFLGRTIERADPDAWPPASVTHRLRGLANAQFAEAKFWYQCVTYLYVLAAMLAALAFATDESASRRQYATIAAVICQILAACARQRAIRLHEIAHQADWRELIMDSMGSSTAENERAIALEGDLSDGARARAGELPAYYSSTDLTGPDRLVANLRETAFFTSVLYKAAYVRAFFYAVIVLIIPIVPLAWGMIQGIAIPSSLWIVAVSGVLPLWDVVLRVRTWRDAAGVLARVTDSLVEVTTVEAALPLLADAVIATATAPPIPRPIYAKRETELRERWQRMNGSTWPDEDPTDALQTDDP